MRKIALWEARHPKLIILVALCLLVPSIICFALTRVNYDLMSFLPNTFESVQGEEILDKTFNNAGISIIVFEDFEPKYVAAVKDEIEKIPEVNSVIWVDTLADISIPYDILPDAITDVFYSEDGSSTMMLVQYKYQGSSNETLRAIKQIKSLLNKNTFISGFSAIIEDTKELTETQAPLYVLVAVTAVFIALCIMTESWALPVVILSALGLAVAYNMGTNIFKGEISFITQSIAAILQLGVTMDYSVFLLDRYNEEKHLYSDRTEAMATAVTKSFVALMGSSLTTVFGFIALCFMTLRLGFDIGLVMAKGVVFGILTVVFILPEIILLSEKYIEKYRHKAHLPKFDRLNNYIINHKKIFALIFVLLLFPAYFVQSKNQVYYSFSEALPKNLISIEGLAKLKDDFNMASTQFVIIDDNIPSGTLSQMEEEIKKLDSVSSVLALNNYVGPAIPADIIPDAILDICKKDGKQLMMVNSTYENATVELNNHIEELDRLLKTYDPGAIVTGEGAITKDMIVTSDRDFKVTAIMSIAAIFILLLITFKSGTIPILLIAVIELAIWINLAIAKIIGSDVNFIAPTVINCVQLGATVDYAVLLTTRFREELQLGIPKKEAIHKAANAAEQSIFQSAVVFFLATFGVFLVCNIPMIKGICALLARGAIVSFISVVFFLTPLLYIFEGAISKTTIGWKKSKKTALDVATDINDNDSQEAKEDE
jgi:predicted RND superfamily exporter protein